MTGPRGSRTLDQAIEDFLEKYENKSAHKDYRTTLRQAAEMLAARRVTQMKFLTENHVEDLFHSKSHGWPGRLVVRRPDLFTPAGPDDMAPIAPGTIVNHYRRFKTFLNWCLKRKYISRDLMEDVEEPCNVEEEKHRLTREEVFATIEATEHPRDRILIALAVFTCRRVREITTDLKVGAVHLDHLEISFVEHKNKKKKKGKARFTVPISEELEEELGRWFAFYESKVGPLRPDMLLVPRVAIPTLDGRTRTCQAPEDREIFPYLTYTGENEMLGKALQRAGVPMPRGQKFHAFRRTGARMFYDGLIADGEADALRQTQTFLHHATQEMTERYIGISVDQEKVNKRIKGRKFMPDPTPTKADLPENVIQLRRGA